MLFPQKEPNEIFSECSKDKRPAEEFRSIIDKLSQSTGKHTAVIREVLDKHDSFQLGQDVGVVQQRARDLQEEIQQLIEAVQGLQINSILTDLQRADNILSALISRMVEHDDA